MADDLMNADEWMEAEGVYQEALEGALLESDAGEVRYALTAAGALALGEGGAFSGFGPCAASGAAMKAAAATRLRPARERTRRPTPLFG